jgi:hypothetical protein
MLQSLSVLIQIVISSVPEGRRGLTLTVQVFLSGIIHIVVADDHRFL